MLNSFFIAGFPGASRVNRSGARTDAAERCGHQRFYAQDYARAKKLGLMTARETVQWSMVERVPGHYDFSSVRRKLQAAQAQGLQLIWTLLDGSWPADVDVMRPAFVLRFTAYARAFARFLNEQAVASPIIVPINEIGPLARAGGELGYAFPFLEDRGLEMRCQLVRAAISAIDAMREVNSAVRIMHVEPLVHVAAHPYHPEDQDAAEAAHREQYAVFDMLAGRTWPQLGGREQYLDIIGLSHYLSSQYYYGGPRHPGKLINPQAGEWRRLSDLLSEVGRRYVCPMMLAATGHDGTGRSAWLRYVCREVQNAMSRAIPIRGLCLAPVVDSAFQAGERRAATGLWGDCDEDGERPVDMWLAKELREQQRSFERLQTPAANRSETTEPAVAAGRTPAPSGKA